MTDELIKIAGAHNLGIDMIGATFASGSTDQSAIRLPSNSYITMSSPGNLHFRYNDVRQGWSFDSGIVGSTITQLAEIDGASGAYAVQGNRIIGPQTTGWTKATGRATRTGFATSSVTLQTLAEHVNAMMDDFGLAGGAAHGAISTST